MLLNHIYTGDALEILSALPCDSMNCIVTSPPYYGLRNYGVSGQIGLEDTPARYIERLVEVFSEYWRVLKKDGTFWLNIGDSYAGSGRGKGDVNRKSKAQNKASYTGDIFNKPCRLEGYKNKDLMGIPWMLAFALRNRGWYLRQDIIWHKPNPMPESVRDRCTKSHEYLFLLTKSANYYFDHSAMLEPAKYDGRKKMIHEGSKKYTSNTAGVAVQTLSKSGRERWPDKLQGYTAKNGATGLSEQYHGRSIDTLPARNKRSVLTSSNRHPTDFSINFGQTVWRLTCAFR